MLRIILSVIASALIGFFVIAFMETVSMEIVPPPADIEYMNPESVKENMDRIPIASFLLIWLSYIIGSFVAGGVTAVLCRENQFIAAMFTGLLLTLGGIGNLYLIPHPFWFAVGTTLSYIPFALFGAIFGRNIKSKEII